MPKIILNGVDYYKSTISGGDSVEWSQIETGGTKIAEVTINGDMTEVYAPSGGGSSGINYSTQEQVVGTWIDGKPLYQKTINLGSLIMDTSFHSVAHGINDFGVMVQAEGSFYDGSQWRNIETYRPTSTYGVNVNVTPTNINYINNWVSSVQQAYLTIWYTKTTD